MCLKNIAISLSRQRWLPYKTRRSVIKQLYPAMLKDFPFDVEFFDASWGMRFSGNIVNYIDRLIYFCGAHEKYMLCLLRDYVKNLRASGQESIIFVDVGANAGNHTLFMAKIVEHVHAFEPFERVRTQLETNLAKNKIANVTVHPFGLSDKEAVMPFYSGPDSNLGAASFNAAHKQDNFYLGDMRLRRGDDVMQEASVARVNIIKADIEGFEKFALDGLKATMDRDRPLLIIEVSPSTRETLGSAQALQAMFPPRYRFYYFSKGNLNSGQYQLKPYDYALTPKIQDVIACPEEKLSALPLH